jgi:hypothetical protein
MVNGLTKEENMLPYIKISQWEPNMIFWLLTTIIKREGQTSLMTIPHSMFLVTLLVSSLSFFQNRKACMASDMTRRKHDHHCMLPIFAQNKWICLGQK